MKITTGTAIEIIGVIFMLYSIYKHAESVHTKAVSK